MKGVTSGDHPDDRPNGFRVHLSLVGSWTPETWNDLTVDVWDDGGATTVSASECIGGQTSQSKQEQAKAALIALLPDADGSVGQSWAIKQAAKQTGVEGDPKTVRRALDKCIKEELIEQRPLPGGKPNEKELVAGPKLRRD